MMLSFPGFSFIVHLKKHNIKTVVNDCIVVFRDHVIRKKTGSGKSEVWIRHNELEGIRKDFKPDVTEAEKKKIAINLLDDETREMKGKLMAKM